MKEPYKNRHDHKLPQLNQDCIASFFHIAAEGKLCNLVVSGQLAYV